jgi:hypothetical protein
MDEDEEEIPVKWYELVWEFIRFDIITRFLFATFWRNKPRQQIPWGDTDE